MIGFGEFWELDVALLALNSFAQAAFAQASSSTGRAQKAKQQSSARWTTLPDIDLPEDRFMFAVSCCILIICFYKDIPVPAKKQAGIGTNRRNHGKSAPHRPYSGDEARILPFSFFSRAVSGIFQKSARRRCDKNHVVLCSVASRRAEEPQSRI